MILSKLWCPLCTVLFSLVQSKTRRQLWPCRSFRFDFVILMTSTYPSTICNKSSINKKPHYYFPLYYTCYATLSTRNKSSQVCYQNFKLVNFCYYDLEIIFFITKNLTSKLSSRITSLIYYYVTAN